MKYKTLLFALSFSILFASCSNIDVSGRSVKSVSSKTVYLSSDRQIDDYTIHTAIAKELQQRGFTVIDRKSAPPAKPVTGIVLRYMDTWRWDLTMYMSALNIRLQDGRTSEMLASASYKTSGFHTYPNSAKVVAKLFADLDSKGVFK